MRLETGEIQLPEQAGRRVACEISVTTSDTWETHNVEKCLSAGYAEVLVISNDAKNLERIRKQIQAKIFTFEPHEAIQWFDRQIVQDIPTEKISKGYRVKVKFGDTGNEKMRKMHGSVVKAVTEDKRKKK